MFYNSGAKKIRDTQLRRFILPQPHYALSQFTAPSQDAGIDQAITIKMDGATVVVESSKTPRLACSR